MSQPQAGPDWRTRIRGSRTGSIVVIGVTALAVGLGVWLVQRPAADEDGSGGAVSQVEVDGVGVAPKVGEAAPAFTATSLAGDEVQVGAAGRGTWLLFVATVHWLPGRDAGRAGCPRGGRR